MNKKIQKALRIKRMKRYIRLGECNQCGDCCDNEDCEYFERVSPDHGICTIYGEQERPRKCVLFPEGPQHPFDRCGYWFQDRHDGGKWIKPKGMQ